MVQLQMAKALRSQELVILRSEDKEYTVLEMQRSQRAGKTDPLATLLPHISALPQPAMETEAVISLLILGPLEQHGTAGRLLSLQSPQPANESPHDPPALDTAGRVTLSVCPVPVEPAHPVISSSE